MTRLPAVFLLAPLGSAPAPPLRTEKVHLQATGGVVDITLPASCAHDFVRIEAKGRGPERAWLNGRRVSNQTAAEWDLTSGFRFGASNSIRVEGGEGECWLVHGPKVFIERTDLPERKVTTWVRNTLDNTVNVDVELVIRLSETGETVYLGESSATVPPSTVLPVDFSTDLRSGTYRIRTLLTKHTEAVESGYDVVDVGDVTVPPAQTAGEWHPNRH